MDYASYVSQLASTLIMDSADAEFTVMLPLIIEYAENRCYQELDILATRYRDTSVTLSPSIRDFTIPSGFIVVEEINVITPSGTTVDTGTRNSLTPVSLAIIDACGCTPSTGPTGVPSMFAIVNSTTIALLPRPAGAYSVEVIGTKRPSALSATNTTTPLTSYCPALFFCASMVFASGWQRDFGQQADDPSKAVSWENQYQTLAASANLEMWRQKIMGSAWTAKASSPTAKPERQ